MTSAVVLTHLERVEVAFLQVADIAENAGEPSHEIVRILGAMEVDLQPIVNAAATLDPATLQRTLTDHADTLVHARAFLPRWSDAVARGAELSRKAIAAADAAMIVLSIYDAGRTLADALGRARGPGMIGGVGLGGVAVVATAGSRAIALTPELADALRKLAELGALDAAVVNNASLTSVRPADGAPSLGSAAMVPTPSGKITPTTGPMKDATVTYGDPRNKHTKVGQYTLEELREALRRPNKAKGKELGKLAKAICEGDTEYGSQLSKEGVARYEELVRDAIENGTEKNGKFYGKAKNDIGIDVETGEPTPRYRVDGAPHGAHIIPQD